MQDRRAWALSLPCHAIFAFLHRLLHLLRNGCLTEQEARKRLHDGKIQLIAAATKREEPVDWLWAPYPASQSVLSCRRANIKHRNLPTCSRTLSVIYLTHCAFCLAWCDTDQSKPRGARQPVTQERHAAARSSLLSVTLASTHDTFTQPRLDCTCCNPRNVPCNPSTPSPGNQLH